MQKIHCDRCDSHGDDVKRIRYPYDSRMDAAGDKEILWVVADLCPSCFNLVLLRALEKAAPDKFPRGQLIKEAVEEILK